MSSGYKPPYHLTDKMLGYVADIAQLSERIETIESVHDTLKLRRESRIRTIHSSLAIEQNILTVDQVTAVINGKKVLAPPKDIKEVLNAYSVYDRLDIFDPCSVKDLLSAHRIMMGELITDAGVFRDRNAGVFDGAKLIHAGSPAKYVPGLVNDLFDWLKNTEVHPLVASCIFHYEFEFIHPFSDGNGRTGRFWHTLILSKWKPIFAWMPVETIVYNNQQEYYDAIEQSTKDTDCAVFIELMLKLILDALNLYITQSDKSVTQDDTQDVTQDGVDKKIIEMIKADNKVTTDEIAASLGISSRTVKRRINKMEFIKFVGSGYSGHWEIEV
jgi:Fic family protein